MLTSILSSESLSIVICRSFPFFRPRPFDLALRGLTVLCKMPISTTDGGDLILVMMKSHLGQCSRNFNITVSFVCLVKINVCFIV